MTDHTKAADRSKVYNARRRESLHTKCCFISLLKLNQYLLQPSLAAPRRLNMAFIIVVFFPDSCSSALGLTCKDSLGIDVAALQGSILPFETHPMLTSSMSHWTIRSKLIYLGMKHLFCVSTVLVLPLFYYHVNITLVFMLLVWICYSEIQQTWK